MAPCESCSADSAQTNSVELQLRFARKSAEAKEHNGKRMWLEKKLSAQTLRLQLLEDGVKALQSARKMMMAEKRGLSTELGRTKPGRAEPGRAPPPTHTHTPPHPPFGAPQTYAPDRTSFRAHHK